MKLPTIIKNQPLCTACLYQMKIQANFSYHQSLKLLNDHLQESSNNHHFTFHCLTSIFPFLSFYLTHKNSQKIFLQTLKSSIKGTEWQFDLWTGVRFMSQSPPKKYRKTVNGKTWVFFKIENYSFNESVKAENGPFKNNNIFEFWIEQKDQWEHRSVNSNAFQRS